MAVKRVRFKINNRGVTKAATGPESKAAVLDMATKMRAYAVSIAPKGETGTYSSSFGIRQHIRRDWPPKRPDNWGPNPRACADMYNSDPAAIVIEKGGARTTSAGKVVPVEAFRVLQKTLAHHGPHTNRSAP